MKVLVAAASRHGSTHEIAAEIARVLRDRGLDCDVSAVEEAEPPAGYDAVVLGSGVYVGRWLEPARSFAERHCQSLASRPTWLFSSGPVGDPPKPDAAHAVDVAEIEQQTQSPDHRLFAGNLDVSVLGPLERTIVRAVRARNGDVRDWDAVRRYANAIADDCGA